MDEAETQMDRIISDYGGLTMGDAGARMDEALAPRRRRMVEVQNTNLGDAWIVPAEDAEKLAKDIGSRVREKRMTAEQKEAIRKGIHVEVVGPSLRLSEEEEEAMRTKFREDVQAGREIPF